MQSIKNKQIEEYLKETVGLPVSLTPLSISELRHLPLYLRHRFTYLRMHLADRPLLLAPEEEKTGTPEQYRKLAEVLRSSLNLAVVFAFRSLAAYERKRLIQKKIPFIVPAKQLYIPHLLLDLREVYGEVEKPVGHLSPATQCLLLYHLIREPMGNLPFGELSRRSGYAPVTINRVSKELTAIELCTVEGTKEKRLVFNPEKRKIWEKALPYLTSPVKETLQFPALLPPIPSYASALTALAKYTDLAESQIQYRAVGALARNKWMHGNSQQGMIQLEETFFLEVWNYDPGVLTNSDVVDPLSLYLSLRHQMDERIQLSLTQLIDELPW